MRAGIGSRSAESRLKASELLRARIGEATNPKIFLFQSESVRNQTKRVMVIELAGLRRRGWLYIERKRLR